MLFRVLQQQLLLFVLLTLTTFSFILLSVSFLHLAKVQIVLRFSECSPKVLDIATKGIKIIAIMISKRARSDLLVSNPKLAGLEICLCFIKPHLAVSFVFI